MSCTEGKCKKLVKCQRVLSANLDIRLNEDLLLLDHGLIVVRLQMGNYSIKPTIFHVTFYLFVSRCHIDGIISNSRFFDTKVSLKKQVHSAYMCILQVSTGN